MDRPVTIADFEHLLAIDQDDLDTSIVDQPTLYWWVGERLAELQSEVSALKGDLEIIEAQVDKRIRDNWDEDESGKISNPVVAHAVARNKKVREAKRELREAVLEAAKFNRLEMAFSDRSRQLTSLVRLRTQEFFADPIRSDKGSRDAAHSSKRRRIAASYEQRRGRK